MNFGDTNLQSVISGVVVLRLDKINFTVRNTSKDKFDSDSEESACNAVDLGSIPGLGRSPGEGNGCPLQYSCSENSMNRGAWRATVHGVAKSRTRLSN